MTLEEMAATIKSLQEENAALKAKLAELDGKKSEAAFSEKVAVITTAKNAETARADKAEADLKAFQATIAKAKQTAMFAEIEAELIEAHKSGLPMTHADHFRTVAAAERGLILEGGTVSFAEGKSGNFGAAMKALREAKYLPMTSKSGEKIDKVEFAEGDIEAEIVKFAEENKIDITKAAGYAKAATGLEAKRPELFAPDGK